MRGATRNEGEEGYVAPAENGEELTVDIPPTNVLTGESGLTVSQIARHYKAQGVGSVVVGDENYGEGRSREQQIAWFKAGSALNALN